MRRALSQSAWISTGGEAQRVAEAGRGDVPVGQGAAHRLALCQLERGHVEEVPDERVLARGGDDRAAVRVPDEQSGGCPKRSKARVVAATSSSRLVSGRIRRPRSPPGRRSSRARTASHAQLPCHIPWTSAHATSATTPPSHGRERKRCAPAVESTHEWSRNAGSPVLLSDVEEVKGMADLRTARAAALVALRLRGGHCRSATANGCSTT